MTTQHRPPDDERSAPDRRTAPQRDQPADLPRWEPALIVAMVGLGIAARLWPRGSLWLDEALSVNLGRLPLSELPAALKQDGHPPLYYELLHVWTGVLGTSTFVVRMMSIITSLLGLPLVWLVGRKAGGARVGMWAVAIWAVLPYGVRYATETRMYVMVMVLVLVGWWFLDRLWDRPNWRDAVGLAAAGSLLLWMHYWSMWLLAAVGLAAALRWWLNRGDERANRELLFTGGALGVAGLSFLPWVPTLLYQSEHTGTPWGLVERPTTAVVITLIDFAGRPSAEPQLTTYVLVFLVLVALVGRGRGNWAMVLEGPVRRSALWPLALAGLTLLLGSLAAMVSGATFVSRYAAVIYPMAIVLIGWGLASCPPRLRAVLGTAVLAGSLIGIALEISLPRSNSGRAAEVIASEAPDALVVTCPDQLSVSLGRELGPGHELLSYPELNSDPRFVNWVDYAERVNAADPAAVAAEVWQRADGRTVVLGTADTYVTHKQACPDFEEALRKGHQSTDLLVADGDDAFEHMSLVRFEP